MTKRMVVDASVAAKWFLRDALEDDIDIADDILLALLVGDLELHVPRLFIYEFCSLLKKACASRPKGSTSFRLTLEAALKGVGEVFNLPIRFAEASEVESREALEMAVKFSKSHYDMTYVRLAESLDCQWCTADLKSQKAVPADFPHDRILQLSTMRTVK